MSNRRRVVVTRGPKFDVGMVRHGMLGWEHLDPLGPAYPPGTVKVQLDGLPGPIFMNTLDIVPLKTPTTERIENAVGQALDAFWNSIEYSFPEATRERDWDHLAETARMTVECWLADYYPHEEDGEAE